MLCLTVPSRRLKRLERADSIVGPLTFRFLEGGLGSTVSQAAPSLP